MFKLVIATNAKATLVTLSNQVPACYTEMHLTLVAASRGLAGSTLIGVVNHSHDVHFLEPAGSGKPMLVVTDCRSKPDLLMLVDFPSNPRAGGLSIADKRHLSERAADLAGIYATHIYIP